MKNQLFALLLFIGVYGFAQTNPTPFPNGIKTTKIDSYASGKVDVNGGLNVLSTTKGALFCPMTTTQKNAIVSPATGLLVFDTTLGSYNVYNGTAWVGLGGGNASGDGVTITGGVVDLQNITPTAVNGLFVNYNGALNNIELSVNSTGNTGFSNVMIGYESGINNTANNSVGIGIGALTNNTGGGSVGIGTDALLNNTGVAVVGIGSGALSGNSGLSSTGVGNGSLVNNTGNNVTALGVSSGASNAFNNTIHLSGNNNVIGTAATADNQFILNTNGNNIRFNTNVATDIGPFDFPALGDRWALLSELGSGGGLNPTGADIGATVQQQEFEQGIRSGGNIMLGTNVAGGIISDSGYTTVGDFNGNGSVNQFVIADPISAAYYDNPSHNGKFGINTNAPTVALDVVGDIHMNGSKAVTEAALAAFVPPNKLKEVGIFSETPTTSTSTITVTLATPQPDANYQVFITPANFNTGLLDYYILSKTTGNFVIEYYVGINGQEISFDYTIYHN